MVLTCFACQNKEHVVWNSTNDLDGTWIKLERDEQGYLYYEPCDSGFTSTLKIDDDQLLFQSGHEGLDSLRLASIGLKNSQTEIHFVGTNQYHHLKGVLKRIPDNEKLFLFSWDFIVENDENAELKNKMVMTRLDYKPQFRFVDNPCPTGRIQEKNFLSIEF